MIDSKQKILSSKTVFKAKLFNVSEDLILSNEKEYHFATVHIHPTVCILPITPKGEIYLIKQFRYLLEGTVLGAIAGFIDEGETSLQAAKRELKEEAGIEAAQWELLAKTVVMRSVVHHVVNIFLAKDLEITKQNLQDEEEIEVVKMPISEAVEKVMSGEIYHSSSMTAILMLDKLRQEKRL